MRLACRLPIPLLALAAVVVLAPACFGRLRPGGLAPASAEAPRSPASRLAGTWYSDRAVPGDADRSLVLTLSADGRARLEVAVDRGESRSEGGRWSFGGERLTVELESASGVRRLPLVFALEGERLVPQAWDPDLYGPSGLPLHRR